MLAPFFAPLASPRGHRTRLCARRPVRQAPQAHGGVGRVLRLAGIGGEVVAIRKRLNWAPFVTPRHVLRTGKSGPLRPFAAGLRSGLDASVPHRLKFGGGKAAVFGDLLSGSWGGRELPFLSDLAPGNAVAIRGRFGC